MGHEIQADSVPERTTYYGTDHIHREIVASQRNNDYYYSQFPKFSKKTIIDYVSTGTVLN